MEEKWVDQQNENLEDASKKPLVIKEDGTFTLYRKTRAGSINANGIVYTKEAFDEAMKKYMAINGRMFLAPSVVESGYDSRTIKKINTEVYVKFHGSVLGPRQEYTVGQVCSWDDFTITCKYTPTSTTEKLINTVLEKSKIQIRYLADPRCIPVRTMRITCLDIACIPFDVLSINLDSYK